MSPAGGDDQSRRDLDFVAGAGINLKAEASPYRDRTPVIVMRRRASLRGGYILRPAKKDPPFVAPWRA